MRPSCLGTAAILAVAPGLAAAQEEVKDVGKLRLDLSVPDVPAFVALDVSPEKVARPTTARELAIALANGFSPTGAFQSGIAIEVSPLGLAGLTGDTMDLLRPFRVSVASTAKSEEGVTTAQVAAGLRWTFHAYDPAADPALKDCLRANLPQPTIPGQPLDAGQQGAEVKPQGIENCRAAFRTAHLTSSAIELAGVVSGSTTDDANLKNLGRARGSVWLSGTLGLNLYKPPAGYDGKQAPATKGKFGVGPTVLARRDFGARQDEGTEGATDPTAAVEPPPAYDLFLGVRLPVLFDGVGVFAEYGMSFDDLRGEVERSSRIGTGLDVRVSNGVWLGVFLGGTVDPSETPGEEDKAGLLALSNLRWSLGEERFFGNP